MGGIIRGHCEFSEVYFSGKTETVDVEVSASHLIGDRLKI